LSLGWGLTNRWIACGEGESEADDSGLGRGGREFLFGQSFSIQQHPSPVPEHINIFCSGQVLHSGRYLNAQQAHS